MYKTIHSEREYEPFWSTEGCRVVNQTSERTQCVCYHLTHFCILFDSRGGASSQVRKSYSSHVHKRMSKQCLGCHSCNIVTGAQQGITLYCISNIHYFYLIQLSSENETALRLITYIGVGFSLLALILTLISFVILRYLKS